jgi:hypothetical protein
MNKHKLTAFYNALLLLATIGIFAPALASDNDEIVLPLEFSTQGFPIASIHIQGHDVPLLFDNGASRTTITLSKDLVKKLGLKMAATNKKNCFHDGTGKKTCLKVYTVPEIKIGHMTMHNVPCQLMEKLWGGHYEDGFIWFEAAKNGVIGIDLLRQFNVLVDYQTSQAILTKLGEYPHQYDVKNWIQIPFAKKSGIINAKINGADAKIVFDSGSNASVMKSTAKIPVQEIEKKSCASINDKSCSYYFETTTFVVDNKQLPKTKFVVQKSAGEDKIPFDALIGSDFIKKHPIFFDFKNDMIFIKP